MSLEEEILEVMDRKDHWAWPHLTRPGLARPQLLAHFRHEYQVYVRDFPVLLARILGQGPPTAVRAALAENIFEEETGKLSLGVPHPVLFLEMMEGLGFKKDDLERDPQSLEPEAKAYRKYLEDVTITGPWQIGAAVMTIFVEGSKNERAQLQGKHVDKPIDEAIAAHPMVKHYGCPPERLRLVRAHRQIEGSHRDDAWKMILDEVPAGSALANNVVAATRRAQELWFAYRDGVARAMGLARG
jgi:pyrroloquinoline quinone (PQQ) biosynthesis protein C